MRYVAAHCDGIFIACTMLGVMCVPMGRPMVALVCCVLAWIGFLASEALR